jgi:hypothetical protein
MILLHYKLLRLHHNVIKTGIRMISLSYSKISLEEIASKLQLDSPEDAEFIVAKVWHWNILYLLSLTLPLNVEHEFVSPYNWNFDLDKNFITAWKRITKLVIFQSFVAKCCKMRIILPCEVCRFSGILYYAWEIDNPIGCWGIFFWPKWIFVP